MKRTWTFAERTLEHFESLQMGPCLKGEEGRGGAGRVPARRVAGGEGRGAREHQWFKAHLLVYLSGVRNGRRGFVREEQNAAPGVLDGSDAPAGGRQREVVG